LHLGIKAKLVFGVSIIFGLAVVVQMLIYAVTVSGGGFGESRHRAELLAETVFSRAKDVVPGAAEPYAALAADGGLRTILTSAATTINLTYAAICKPDGVVVAGWPSSLEGRPLPAAGELKEFADKGAFERLAGTFWPGVLTREVRHEMLLGGEKFGSIRVGVSMLLVRRELLNAARPMLEAGLIALLVAMAAAASFAQRVLRPIRVIRSGLTRLGRGEFDVKLDLPQQDEFGELGSFFNTMTAQLSADRSQLADEKASLQSAVEHMEDEVALFNPAGELLFANPAMLRTLPPEPFGRPVDDLLGADHPYREMVDEAIARRQSTGPISVNVPPVSGGAPEGKGTGERLLMAHAIKDRAQNLVGVMLMARDVEVIGRVQSMLNYSRKLAALGRLSAGVAHEVRNPLNAMTIHLELLKQKLIAAALAAVSSADGGREDLAPVLEHAKIISAEIKRLDQVMQGFLKFTRSEDLKLQAVALGPLVNEVVHVIEPECAGSHVTIVTEGLDAVPEIRGDPGMLRQSFLNLALNACQAMPSGGTLRISAEPRGGRVRIAFADSGVGIKPEHLNRIFDLYFTTREKGSGIGLSMVYRTVQLHDGEIEVESTEGQGTTFRIDLPEA
jgi:signal transduction histidine kinase/HAMP domain-containing protein